MRPLPALFASLLLCISLVACDSAEPAEPSTPLRGTYIGEWQSSDADVFHILAVTLDEVREGDFVGEARLIRRRGPITGGALLFPFWGNRTGEELRFVAPIALDYRLDFIGMGRDSMLVGTLSGTLPPESYPGTDETVQTEITLVRDGLLTP
jgi:hypothetical protein